MALKATISKRQFLDNITAVKKHTGKKIIAVVKADAYAHGAVELSMLAQSKIDEFAVAELSEANVLHNVGIKKPINILSPLDKKDAHLKANMIPTVCSLEDIQIIRKAHPPSRAVNLEINTGMNRLGVDPWQVTSAEREIKLAGLKLRSVFSHLHNGTNLQDALNQYNKFASCTAGIDSSVFRHLAASTCIGLPSKFYFDAVRVGLSLYGYSEITKPIMKIEAPILKIFDCLKGEYISYGDFKAPRNMRLAAVRAGYADGVRRRLDLKTENRYFSFKGLLCPIIGQVCMDITMIDVTNLPVTTLDKVGILDNNITAEMIAAAENTNVYEILTNFKGRVNREYE